ncbi:tetratricopeptide repeat protein, partial [uncultured Gimesia sp.]|uniref:tetratricopeptide repeat protein n=1 Tax=uncultured Gimesia sp. TaxID=1678688 RepID=UPI00263171D4
ENYDYAISLKEGLDVVTAYHGRGEVWYKKGEYDKAILDFSKAIRNDEKSEKNYVSRGNAWCKRGEYENAIKDYKAAMHVAPEDPLGYSQLAWLLATCAEDQYRDGKQAVELAIKACELSKWNDAGSMNSLAASYAEVGDFERAENYQKMCILELDRKINKYDYTIRLKRYFARKPFRGEKVDREKQKKIEVPSNRFSEFLKTLEQ